MLTSIKKNTNMAEFTPTTVNLLAITTNALKIVDNKPIFHKKVRAITNKTRNISR